MGCGLFVGAAVEISEVVRGGRCELWQDHAWWSDRVRVAVEICGLL